VRQYAVGYPSESLASCKNYCLHRSQVYRCAALYIMPQQGMTNYRIGRIGTHRQASERIGPEFDHIDQAKEGQGYETTVSGYEYWANDNW